MLSIIDTIRRNGPSSPYGPAYVSCVVFLVAWLFPPGIYSSYLREPDLMFLDSFSLLFFSLCVVAFFLGLRTHRMNNLKGWTKPFPGAQTASPVIFICVPLAIAMILCGNTLRIFGAHVNFVALLASSQGNVIKGYGSGGGGYVNGFWTKAPILLTGTLWWSLVRISQLRMHRSARALLTAFWLLALFLNAFTFVAMVDRTSLIPLLTGSMMIYLFLKKESGQLKLSNSLLYAFIGGASIIVLFSAIAYMRGNVVGNLLVASLLGYAIASYNRFAAVLHGQMHYFYAGRGVYLAYYLQNAPAVQRLFKVLNAFQWPTSLEIYNSEFASVGLAGLNMKFNLAGVFGYLYADIGWAALIYLFGVGYLSGYLWTKFRAGSATGMVLYPWVASWILLWNTWNLIFNDDFVHLIPAAIALALWDRLLLRTEKSSSAVAVPKIGQRPLVHFP